MKKLISVCFLVFSLLLANVAPAFAADHYGDAVYRNGVTIGPINISWHAAINNNATVGYSVIQAPGGSGVVQSASWATFLGGKVYQGPPQYKSGMTDNDLNNVLYTARVLANQANVAYTSIDLMHNISSGYIPPYQVTQLRCDGLVEYCYEWNEWPVLYDKNSRWDISNTISTPYHSSLYPVTNGGNGNPHVFSPVTQWTYMDPHYN